MELNYNIFSVLNLVSFLQGIFLGTLLIVLNRVKYRSTFFLGLLIILFTLTRLHSTFGQLNLYEYYPSLFRLPFNFYWLVYPLFFVYSYRVSMLSDQKIPYWVLYPGIISFVINVIIFIQPYETKVLIDKSLWYKTYLITGIAYAFCIGIWNFILINKHRAMVKNHFSRTQLIELSWVRYFLIFSIVAYAIYFPLFYLASENVWSKIFVLIIDYIILYWIFFFGLIQRNVLSILSENGFYSLQKNLPNQGEVKPSSESLELLFQKIDSHMKISECFTNSELTIVDVAQDLQIHSKQISTAINTVQNQNFNSYVNRFRIRKAMILLRNEKINLSIEGIGYEVGFHSKSAFYAAFKKVVDTTPTKFKEKNATSAA